MLALHCGKIFLRRKSGGVTVVRDDCHVWRNLTPMKPAAAAQSNGVAGDENKK